MWNRIDLKQKGKAAFKRNKLQCIISGVLLTISLGGITLPSKSSIDLATEYSGNISIINEIGEFARNNQHLLYTLASFSTILFLLNIFVFHPLEIGLRKFFTENASKTSTVSEHIKFGFEKNYKNIVAATLTTRIYLALLTLLFIIPGIIGAYAWRMVPFILAENPDMKGAEARKLSEKMMKGSKMDSFILDISFIGWVLLGALTFGIVNIIWTDPYRYATESELYLALSKPEEVNQKEASKEANGNVVDEK